MMVTEGVIILNEVIKAVKEVEVDPEIGLKPLVFEMNLAHHHLMSRIPLQGLCTLFLFPLKICGKLY